jgi:hypothetical protein
MDALWALLCGTLSHSTALTTSTASSTPGALPHSRRGTVRLSALVIGLILFVVGGCAFRAGAKAYREAADSLQVEWADSLVGYASARGVVAHGLVSEQGTLREDKVLAAIWPDCDRRAIAVAQRNAAVAVDEESAFVPVVFVVTGGHHDVAPSVVRRCY